MEEKESLSPVSGTGVNSPDLDPDTLEVQQRAIKDGKQALNVFKSLFKKNAKRTATNAEISELYTGKQPKDPKELAANGRSWESNFPTLFLAGLVDRVVPTLVNAIDSARYLTQAKLEDDEQDRSKKTEQFRTLFTKTVRGWKEWRNLVYSLCQENVLIGYGFAVYTDEETPFPTFARQDRVALDEGSPQYASGVQVWALKNPILIHDFVDIIRNKQAAEDAGWDIDNCVKAANESLPRSQADATEDNVRSYADIIREGNPGMGFSEGSRTVDMGHLFAIEPDSQKVSHFIVNERNGDLLFERFDRYESMGEVLSIITLEPGNGKAYGSKGMGRMLGNFSIGVDAATNDAVDQVRIGGMLIAKTSSKGAVNATIRVRKPFIVINDDLTLAQEKLSADPEAFVALYSQLSRMAEVAAGAYIPNLLSSDGGGRDKTAREATIDYNREIQSKTAFVTRFRGQFGEIMSMVQARLCKKGTADKDAKEFQKKLKEFGFKDEEIKEIGESPAAELAQDLSSVEAEQKVAIYDKYQGNPNIDQIKTLEGAVMGMSNPDYAKEIIIPGAVDPTVEAEQTRLQIMENAAIMSGESVPVSPRDRHDLHLKYMVPEMMQRAEELMKSMPGAIQQLLSQPELLDHFTAGIVHGNAHADMLEQMMGMKDEANTARHAFKIANDIVEKVAGELKRFMLMQQQQQAMQQQQQMMQEQAGKSQRADQLAQQIIQQPELMPQDPAQEAPPVEAGGVLTEKVLVAWIGQYQNLPSDEKRNLERLGGLGPSEAPNVFDPPPPEEPIMEETLPEEMLPEEMMPEAPVIAPESPVAVDSYLPPVETPPEAPPPSEYPPSVDYTSSAEDLTAPNELVE